MQTDEFNVCFTLEEDKRKRAELVALMDEWKAHIQTKGTIVFADEDEERPAISYFCSDGFYPGYFKPGNKKILFVGREARWIGGRDYIDVQLYHFKNGRNIDTGEPLNVNTISSYRRQFHLVYGIQNEGKVAFENVPRASEIVAGMNKSNEYGFAFMNISKYSNDSDGGATADFSLINRCLSDCDLEKTDFIRREISILEPDIILLSNLWRCAIDKEKLELVFPSKDRKKVRRSKDGDATLYDFSFNGRSIQLVDMWHLSAPGKSDGGQFYDPVMEVLFGGN